MKPDRCVSGCSLTLSRAPLPVEPGQPAFDAVQVCCGTCGAGKSDRVLHSTPTAELKADWPPQDSNNAGFRLEPDAIAHRGPGGEEAPDPSASEDPPEVPPDDDEAADEDDTELLVEPQE